MDLKGVLKEEFQNFVNEASLVKSDKLKFVDTINAQFENYEGFSKDFDVRIEDAKINVYWNVSFWTNPNGIYQFNIEIEKVEGFYPVQYLNRQTDVAEQTTNKNIEEIDWHFQIAEAMMQMGGNLNVMELIFDFKTNVCTIYF